MNLSLSFNFNPKLAEILSFARFAFIFEKLSQIQLKTQQLVSFDSMSSNSPNTVQFFNRRRKFEVIQSALLENNLQTQV